jgi:hypothetical protein
VHAKSNAYPTAMLSFDEKKTDRITMLNEKKKEKKKQKIERAEHKPKHKRGSSIKN